VPAHRGARGAAEHAWKDGDSWRRGRGHAAIVNALPRDCLGDAEGRGGVSGTQSVALRAIMEVATSLRR
jgi:hypothetical protein